MRRGMVCWLFGALGLLLLAGCARPTPSLTATPEEELPPPVTVSTIPFNVSPVEQPTPERSPGLYLNPGTVSLEVGETVTVEVWADGVGEIDMLSLEVQFDPALVQMVDADPAAEGTQAAPGDLMEMIMENRVDSGRLIYQAAVQPGAVAKDTGVLVYVPLRGVSPGSALLRIDYAAAQDAEGKPVLVDVLSDGLVTVGEAALMPEEEQPPPVAETPIPLFFAPTSPMVELPTSSGPGGIYYVVGPGENLFRIGLKFGTTAQAIAAANQIADPRQVRVGTMVLVPVPAPGGGYGYYVQRGDTVYSIARRFGMTVEELVGLNNIGPDFTIYPGAILKVVPRR
ncbi:MAG: LysM peptidoglycan-binding domain-containing protein [Anaerolineae bacterium]